MPVDREEFERHHARLREHPRTVRVVHDAHKIEAEKSKPFMKYGATGIHTYYDADELLNAIGDNSTGGRLAVIMFKKDLIDAEELCEALGLYRFGIEAQ